MSIFDRIQYWFEIKFFTGEQVLGHWILVLMMTACAAVYIWLCFHMRTAGVARRVAIPYFLLFLTAESWLLGFLSAPSDFSVWMMLFELLAAPLLLLACSIALVITRRKSAYDWVALATGFAYPAVFDLSVRHRDMDYQDVRKMQGNQTAASRRGCCPFLQNCNADLPLRCRCPGGHWALGGVRVCHAIKALQLASWLLLPSFFSLWATPFGQQ